jgi:Transposase IS4
METMLMKISKYYFDYCFDTLTALLAALTLCAISVYKLTTTSCLSFESFLHGCNVLYELVKPWANTNSIVVADSYFASVQAALRLKTIGLRFIGVVKTATTGYPMEYLKSQPMPDGKGDRLGLMCEDAESGTKLMAFCWVDRERRYFISTCSSLAPGPPCSRWRWRQVDTTPNADPVYMEVMVPQPEACDQYYAACGKIDQHNKYRQASLMLERKLKTLFWHRRVNQTLFGMNVIDSYLLAVGCQGDNRWGTSGDFFVALASDLIDNNYEQRALRKRRDRLAAATGTFDQVHSDIGPLPASLQLISATPTKRYKKKAPTQRDQGKCMVCKKLSTAVCRTCQEAQPDPSKHQFWICRKAGMACMGAHILKSHPGKALDPSDMDPMELEMAAFL